MLKRISALSLVFAFFLVSGCASTLEETNKESEEAGKPVGKVLRIPNSFSRGIAEGVAGEPESNPYGR
jgi:hypothetical protein